MCRLPLLSTRKAAGNFCRILLFAALSAAATAEDASPQAHIGEIYFLRHALAPGSGDPPGMRLEDPASQRNLSEAGRRQARAIGDALRSEGVRTPIVYTSQWARCRETAGLLGFGAPRPTLALNSFWERRGDEAAILKAFDALVADLPADGPPVIFVTHYVNIEAVTGRAVGSGKGFWISAKDLGEQRHKSHPTAIQATPP